MLKALVRGRESIWEPEVMSAAKRVRGWTFVDIGANTGIYSLALSKNFSRIHAIEPNPDPARTLREKAGANITIHELAMSNMDGETMLYLDRTQGRCSGSADTILERFNYRPASHPEISKSTWEHEGIMVKTARYDTMFPGPVDLVKIDVEGAEFLVLEGMRKALKDGSVKNLVVELHDRERRHELEQLFAKHGYPTKWLGPDHLFAWTR